MTKFITASEIIARLFKKADEPTSNAEPSPKTVPGIPSEMPPLGQGDPAIQAPNTEPVPHAELEKLKDALQKTIDEGKADLANEATKPDVPKPDLSFEKGTQENVDNVFQKNPQDTSSGEVLEPERIDDIKEQLAQHSELMGNNDTVTLGKEPALSVPTVSAPSRRRPSRPSST